MALFWLECIGVRVVKCIFFQFLFYFSLFRPLKGLIRPFKGLIRPFKSSVAILAQAEMSCVWALVSLGSHETLLDKF